MGFTDFLGPVGSIVGGLIGADASGDAADASAAGALAGVKENRRQFDTVLNLQAPAINTGNAARSLLASIMGLEVPGSTYAPGGATAGTTSTPGRTGQFIISNGRRVPVFGERKDTQPVSSTGNSPLTFTNPGSSPMSGDEIQKRLEAFPGYKFAVDQATKAAQAGASAFGQFGGREALALGNQVGGGIALPVFNDYLNRLSSLSGGAQTASNAASNAAINTGNSVAAGLNNAGDARASGILGQAGSQIGMIGGILGGIGQSLGNRVPTPSIYGDFQNNYSQQNPYGP